VHSFIAWSIGPFSLILHLERIQKNLGSFSNTKQFVHYEPMNLFLAIYFQFAPNKIEWHHPSGMFESKIPFISQFITRIRVAAVDQLYT
jgi:hypothetical protein